MNWLGVIVSVFKKMIDLIFFIRHNKAGDAITDAGEISQIFRGLVMERKFNIDGIFLIKAHNGGSRLRPQDFMYRSFINGYVDEEWMSRFNMEDFRDLPVNSYYRMLLERLYKYRQYSVSADTIDDTVLHSLYKAEKIQHSRYFFLEHDNHALWYLCFVSTLEGNTMQDTMQEEAIFMVVKKVRNIIKKY